MLQSVYQAKTELLENVLNDWRGDIVTWTRRDGPKFLVVLIIAAILLRLLGMITRRLEVYSHNQPVTGGLRGQQLRTLASIIRSVGTVLIYFLVGMQVLPLFGVDMKPILASAGIVGLAIGFGSQTLVKDVINGFFILFENQYDIGDVVKLAGVSGTVEAMTLRRTLLRDGDGTLHNVPNSEIKVVSNLTRDWAQIALHIVTDYNENSDRVIKLLQDVAAEVYNDPEYHESIGAQPEVPGIERVTGTEVEYLMLVKVKPGQQYRVSRHLRRRIKECFEQYGIKTGGPAKIYIAETPESNKVEMK
jgi:small conductance mechanosensitive channel